MAIAPNGWELLKMLKKVWRYLGQDQDDKHRMFKHQLSYMMTLILSETGYGACGGSRGMWFLKAYTVTWNLCDLVIDWGKEGAKVRTGEQSKTKSLKLAHNPVKMCSE